MKKIATTRIHLLLCLFFNALHITTTLFVQKYNVEPFRLKPHVKYLASAKPHLQYMYINGDKFISTYVKIILVKKAVKYFVFWSKLVQ